MVRNDSVQAEGQGMFPDSEFAVYLFSDPQLLGLGRADANGNFYVTFPVGFDLPLGEHTLQVVGLNTNGDQIAVSMPVVVIETKAPALEQATTPPLMVTAVAPSSNPIQNLVFLMITIGLLATLFLFMLWRRRKKE
jgi:LPXTG-motif cell wall-anchored protein